MFCKKYGVVDTHSYSAEFCFEHGVTITFTIAQQLISVNFVGT